MPGKSRGLFTGWIPDEQRLGRKSAPEQLLDLHSLLKEEKETFKAVIQENKKAIYLHYHYWQRTDAASIGMEPAGKQSLLAAIKQCWQEAVPEIALLDSQG
ncbi:hypothetical protein [Paenibacillus sp. y28]|uniref:hypothetical protein n=1 Tax=Paenibacillus sp. y28 TaxID=3129110 RepID=UPI003017D207